MEYKIVFSIPVHEKPEVVYDLIFNYKWFNPNCAIVLHLAKSFDLDLENKKKFIDKLNSIEGVYINPKSVRTGFGDIIQAHLLNFEYIKQILDFEYFALGASNDLFIRGGLYEYISRYDAGLKMIPIDSDKTWMASYKVKKDEDLLKIMNSFASDKKQYYRSQVEGCFFKKEIFSHMSEVILKNFDYSAIAKDMLYAREEVYFPTIINLMHITNSLADNYTYNSTSSPSWTVYLKDIECIVKNNLPYYCVKRIERNLNNPIRAYIRQELGGYYDALANFISGVENYNVRLVNEFERKKKIEDVRLGVVEILKNTLKHIKPVRDYIGKHKVKP